MSTRLSRTMGVLLVAAALVPFAAPAATSWLDDTDLHGYKTATLAQLATLAPRDPQLPYELAATVRGYRVVGRLTGNQRTPVTHATTPTRHLMREWVKSGIHSESPASFHLGLFPEVEVEEGGRKFWVLFAHPFSMKAPDEPAKPLPKMQVMVFVEHVGFVAGKPFLVAVEMGSPENMAEMAAQPAVLPPKPEPSIYGPRRLSRFTQGEARVNYGGKEYVFPLDTLEGASNTPGVWESPPAASVKARSFHARYCMDTDDYNCLMVNVGDFDAKDASRPSLFPMLFIGGEAKEPGGVKACKVSMTKTDLRDVAGVYECTGDAARLRKLTFWARQ